MTIKDVKSKINLIKEQVLKFFTENSEEIENERREPIGDIRMALYDLGCNFDFSCNYYARELTRLDYKINEANMERLSLLNAIYAKFDNDLYKDIK
jgi:hypothetical protein